MHCINNLIHETSGPELIGFSLSQIFYYKNIMIYIMMISIITACMEIIPENEEPLVATVD